MVQPQWNDAHKNATVNSSSLSNQNCDKSIGPFTFYAGDLSNALASNNYGNPSMGVSRVAPNSGLPLSNTGNQTSTEWKSSDI